MDREQRHQATARRMATGMGWFSIGLGLAEIFLARPLAKSLGMRGEEGLLRFYGAREVATGIGILGSEDATPWMWGRVGGDALDIATLVVRLADQGRQGNVLMALGAVAGATAMDVVTARMLSAPPRAGVMRDYSGRSGLPKPPDAMRGTARDFRIPADMRAPEGMRPHIH